eukprot:jgi/Ulvmu1/4769/UM020_0054.1
MKLHSAGKQRRPARQAKAGTTLQQCERMPPESPGPSETANSTQDWFTACHRACFNGDLRTLSAGLKACSQAQLRTLDRHGLTLLHVAAMRNHDACVQALIDAGFGVKLKSSAGWLPYQEAAAYTSSRALTTILRAHRQVFETNTRVKLQRLQTTFSDMPDCALQINWDLNSTILGAVLNKHLPRDTYTVWKLGSRLRVDGHLKGMREDSKTLLPHWKYGHFSILLNTARGERMALYVNHDRKTYTVMEVLGKVEDIDSKDGNMDAHIVLAHRDVKRARVKFSNFKFHAVRGWLTSEVHESVGGMQTTVYEATGQLCAVTTKKTPLPLSQSTTHDEYLSMAPAPNVETIVPINLSTAIGGQAANAMNGESPAAASAKAAPAPAAGASSSSKGLSLSSRFRRKRGSSSQSVASADTDEQADSAASTVRKQVAGTGRQVKARMWLAKDSPINQKQLMPLLDIVGSTNQYISKVCSFMEKYGDMDLFPVKVVVPLIVSLRATLTVQHICTWDSLGPAARRSRASVPEDMRHPPGDVHFEPPPGFRQISLDEIEAEQRSKSMKSRTGRHGSVRRTAARRAGGSGAGGSSSRTQDADSLLLAETAPL